MFFSHKESRAHRIALVGATIGGAAVMVASGWSVATDLISSGTPLRSTTAAVAIGAARSPTSTPSPATASTLTAAPLVYSAPGTMPSPTASNPPAAVINPPTSPSPVNLPTARSLDRSTPALTKTTSATPKHDGDKNVAKPSSTDRG